MKGGGGGSSGEHFTHLGLHFFHIGRGGVGSAPPKVRVEDFRLWVEEVELVEEEIGGEMEIRVEEGGGMERRNRWERWRRREMER